MVVVAALGFVALVLMALAGALFGARGMSDNTPEAQPASAPTTQSQQAPAAQTTTTEPPTTRVSPVLGPIVQMKASSEEGDAVTANREAIGDLRPDTVLRMIVTGFNPFASGRASQCVAAPSPHCGNPIPVQFREDGGATFQYLVTTGFAAAAAAGECRADGALCSIVVEDLDGSGRAELTTVFHDQLRPPGVVRVEPSRGLVTGQRVTVRASGLRPGIVVHAALCAVDRSGERRCAAIGDGDAMSVRADGTAETTVTIGDDRGTPVRCNRSPTCVVTVVNGAALVRVESMRITFASPPGSDYDPTRLATGLAIACALLVGVAWLIRRTDWSAVGEEAAPEIDNAIYADLDAIIAALPPEEDVEELMSGH